MDNLKRISIYTVVSFGIVVLLIGLILFGFNLWTKQYFKPAQWISVYTSGSGFGTSVAVCDMDADGFADVVVGAPNNVPPGYLIRSGVVYIFWGNKNGVDERDVSPIAGKLIPGEQFGSVVSCVGDIDANGYIDLAIGAPSTEFSSSNAQGSIFLLYGPVKNKRVEVDQVTQVLPPSNTNFGYAITGIDDINSDGYADIMVSAPYDQFGGGAVYVVYGNARDEDKALNMGKILGEYQGHIGKTIADIGDVDCDGQPNYAVSVEGIDEGNGGFYIFDSLKNITRDGIIRPHVIQIINDVVASEDQNNSFGRYPGLPPIIIRYGGHLSFLPLGDINHDGCADLLVGVERAGLSMSGAVYLLYGSADFQSIEKLSSVSTVVAEGSIENKLGHSMIHAQLNLSLRGQVLIGAPSYSERLTAQGGVQVKTWPLWSEVYSGLGYISSVGRNQKAHLGTSMAKGHIRGSMFEDVVIGAPGGEGEGSVLIIYGQPRLFP